MNYPELLPRFAAGTATDAERTAFNQWLETLPPAELQQVLAYYERCLSAQETFDTHDQPMLDRLLLSIREQESGGTGRLHVLQPLAWVKYAAAIVLLAGAAVFFWVRTNKVPLPGDGAANTSPATPADVAPGKDGAILTLADGRVIVLDSLGNGTIAREGNMQVVLQNGQLTYNAHEQLLSGSPELYNTMQTPRGRQFQLVLPDGTRVWLNAVSSIRYPVAFTGSKREVTITGEAYLEVAPDADKEFVVHTSGISSLVQARGLNVNAYEDEAATRITLVEGKAYVGVQDESRSRSVAASLLPGQQASFVAGKAEPVISPVNLEQVVAWKNGVFNFEHSDLPAAMRQIARWYDVEVVYAGDIPHVEFGGKIQRSLSLSQIIKNLGDNELKFTIKGRQLIVHP
ncbi:MAG: DUF4974 domain-containing protein [Candidatus Pseudobacter hemicellulosilyticus]|uniref:DUF4974 domain-containing protein n=1 Tax=Candidatus Pseudobacter hemicellulosilyticus TaxID=3121375 RepID=A0AAJ6BGP2_9BACT|nr:MAG: DUF4974 domain-containing protein [Pseudobacter sp.]